jgi:hypothetical protein
VLRRRAEQLYELVEEEEAFLADAPVRPDANHDAAARALPDRDVRPPRRAGTRIAVLCALVIVIAAAVVAVGAPHVGWSERHRTVARSTGDAAARPPAATARPRVLRPRAHPPTRAASDGNPRRASPPTRHGRRPRGGRPRGASAPRPKAVRVRAPQAPRRQPAAVPAIRPAAPVAPPVRRPRTAPRPAPSSPPPASSEFGVEG